MYDLNIISWNVKGLGNPSKRKKILSVLKEDKADVVFLQETYLSDNEHNTLKTEWVGQVYFSSYKSHSRGTCILINREVPFILGNLATDPNGRFVMISGTINGTSITFLNIYAPNSDEPTFISDMVLMFNENCKGLGVLGGDFNVTLCSNDKSNQAKASNLKSAKVLYNLCADCGLTDVWRELNPGVRDYTFFSNVHNSYSRLDYFFIPSNYMYTISKCRINPIVLSDHSRVHLTIQVDQKSFICKRWKFNSSLLKDNEFKSNMRVWITNYIKENNNSSLEPSVIWEAAKATLRGLLISYASFKNHEKCIKRKELEREVAHCENLHKNASTEDNWRQLTAARAKLNIMMSDEITQKMNYIRQKEYEFGNKPGKLLAHQIKKEQAEKTIKAIHLRENKITYHPKDINQTFFDFYNNLYKSQGGCSQEELDNYLSNIKLPEVSAQDQQFLNSPFTETEILATINSMPLNKSPGPDGFSVEFYKEFWPEIQPIFMAMVNNFCKKKLLPQTMNLAHISVLHKSGKDPLQCSSYRPISLLDHDYKIITKLLARRLEAILPKLINPDQSGFIKGRYAADNIRRALNVINCINNQLKPSLLLSLDAEKAFDRVEWSFLFSVLHKFNLGGNFIDWIKTIYNSPKAAVITNGHCSEFFFFN